MRVHGLMIRWRQVLRGSVRLSSLLLRKLLRRGRRLREVWRRKRLKMLIELRRRRIRLLQRFKSLNKSHKTRKSLNLQ
jgi:hypothetical protein